MQISTPKTSVLPASTSISKPPTFPHSQTLPSTVSSASTTTLSVPDQMQLNPACPDKTNCSMPRSASTPSCGKSSSLTKVLGGVGLVGGGALAGFLIGGPIGAVIGALIGALLMAMTVLGKSIGALFKAEKPTSALPDPPCASKQKPIPPAPLSLHENPTQQDKLKMPGQKEREARRIKYM